MDAAFKLLKPINLNANGITLLEIMPIVCKIDTWHMCLEKGNTFVIFNIPSEFTLDPISGFYKPFEFARADIIDLTM